eukprot:COSAG02_NODE_33906_length_493_cov_1.175573_1_plen_72_part_01
MFETEHLPPKRSTRLDGAARRDRALSMLLSDLRVGAEPLQRAPATGRYCTGALLRVGNFPLRARARGCESQQ